MMRKITFILFAFISTFGFTQSVATYNIEFTNYWNATDHSVGTTFPGSNAHWSDLVGVNHNSNTTFVQNGVTATKGVEDIAELGDSNIFRTVDVQDAIDANNAEQFFNAGDLFLNEPTNKIILNNLEVNEDFPLLTMLSMIAPSPDWMMFVNGLELRENGNWKTSITIDIYPYDAGTEDGTTYSLSNPATSGGIISSLRNVAPFNNSRVAELKITLASVLSIDTFLNVEEVRVFPNPASDKITLSNIKNSNLERIEIFTILGKLKRTVLTPNVSNSFTVDVSNLTSGVYLLKFSDNQSGSRTQKLIIQ